jgi:hypothetical protein
MNQATPVWILIFGFIGVLCAIPFIEKLSKKTKYTISACLALILGLAGLFSGLKRYYRHDDGLQGSRHPSAWYQRVAVGAMMLAGAGLLFHASKKEK